MNNALKQEAIQLREHIAFNLSSLDIDCMVLLVRENGQFALALGTDYPISNLIGALYRAATELTILHGESACQKK